MATYWELSKGPWPILPSYPGLGGTQGPNLSLPRELKAKADSENQQLILRAENELEIVHQEKINRSL